MTLAKGWILSWTLDELLIVSLFMWLEVVEDQTFNQGSWFCDFAKFTWT
jgi:hypothetical protein